MANSSFLLNCSAKSANGVVPNETLPAWSGDSLQEGSEGSVGAGDKADAMIDNAIESSARSGVISACRCFRGSDRREPRRSVRSGDCVAEDKERVSSRCNGRGFVADYVKRPKHIYLNKGVKPREKNRRGARRLDTTGCEHGFPRFPVD